MLLRRPLQVFRHFSSKKDENWPLLRRELLADVFQNSLKVFAYYVSGSASMKAELMRSVIDASNHLLLFGANWAVIRAAEDPRQARRYEGYDKLKNLVVILPGILFLATGTFNVLSPVLYSLTGGLVEDHMVLSPLSLAVRVT
jgi:divalent metal cation (Fe/Co/Zn/Cd) transporter